MTGMLHENDKLVHRPDPQRKFILLALLPLLLIFFSGNLNAVAGSGTGFPGISPDTVKEKGASAERSKTFYDSIYQKFHRKKFTMFLYELAFIRSPELQLPDSVQKIKSEVQFEKYEGKVIRKIYILRLDPFGTSVVDTNAIPMSGAAKALNKVHIQTREYIIRRQLLFKTGDLVDPVRMGDNLRILRDLPFLSTVRMVITQPDPENDSVDIAIITKDVWSIGFEIPIIALNKVVLRLYDGNFFGLGDKFTNEFSMETKRLPFFRYDGVSYTFSNINGSFIDAVFHFNQDDNKDQNFGGGFQRAFFSTITRWAGGADFEYYRSVNILSDTTRIISFFTDQNLWLGQAFLLKNQKVPTRLILAEAFYWRNFSSRPHVTIDSNWRYYNRKVALVSFAISRNNYYVADYIFRFGIPENVPYGRLLQVTMGPEWSDFYTQFYAGLTVSAGDYIKRAGYLSASFKIGGYIYHYSVLDAVLKVALNYMTPLYPSRLSKYRFRTFLSGDYRLGFNFRKNNTSYADVNRDFLIQNFKVDSVFHGVQVLGTNLRFVMYTPWFFYGFKFALILHFQGGFVASGTKPLFSQAFYSGIGTGIFIRNNNLIFPTATISFYCYPSRPAGVPFFQVNFLDNANFRFPDFNVSQPHAETLDN